jgi:hypothetical protein
VNKGTTFIVGLPVYFVGGGRDSIKHEPEGGNAS